MALKTTSCSIIKFKLFDYELDDFERFYNHVSRIIFSGHSVPDSFEIVKSVNSQGANIKIYSNDEEAFMKIFNKENIDKLKSFARKTFTFTPIVIIDKGVKSTV